MSGTATSDTQLGLIDLRLKDNLSIHQIVGDISNSENYGCYLWTHPILKDATQVKIDFSPDDLMPIPEENKKSLQQNDSIIEGNVSDAPPETASSFLHK